MQSHSEPSLDSGIDPSGALVQLDSLLPFPHALNYKLEPGSQDRNQKH